MGITVLRLEHRAGRDKRVSTHCALVARAFGAERLLYTGQKDSEMEDVVRRMVSEWGGRFSIEHVSSWRNAVKDFRENSGGVSIHLTMYGLPVQGTIQDIRKEKNLLILIGGGKVPMEVYHGVDMNVAVTNQPHSEISALSVILHEYFRGKELSLDFGKAKRKIIPQKAGKKFA